MKTRSLLLLGAAAFAAIALNATAADALLSPRAAGNQIKTVSGTNTDPNLVNTTGVALVSPRTAGNQIKTVAGTGNDVNPALGCVKNMNGTPKQIQACAEHPATMPGCTTVTVAPVK